VGQVSPLLSSSGAILVRTVALQATLLAGTASAVQGPDGEVAAAAHQVCLQLFFLLSFSVDSIAVAAQALVATELGARRPDRCQPPPSLSEVLENLLMCHGT
jgi:Na+-driven multidrug efflux pump